MPLTAWAGIVSPSVYEALFSSHRSARVPTLWAWQSEVLEAYSELSGDAAVELPTGTGKTLIGLLAGEYFRQAEGAPVAYFAGNEQLALQVERQARDLGFPSCASRTRRTPGTNATSGRSTSASRSG